MLRVLAVLSVFLVSTLVGKMPAGAQGTRIETDIPSDIEECLESGLTKLLNISRSDRASLFEYFLTNIDVESFGRYNFKRAWVDWASNPEIQRLALYEYFHLMTGRRGEHPGGTTAFNARLADRPAVTGENVYHIIATLDFEDGSSTTIVVFTVGCKAFGFMYGGSNLRSFVDASMVERLYRSGNRAPF